MDVNQYNIKKLFHLKTKTILIWLLGHHTCYISAFSSIEHAESYDILLTYTSELWYVKNVTPQPEEPVIS